MTILDLFLTFAKIGLFTFGGGYAMIALIEDICVEKKQWITPDEMMNVTVIAESTPGPIGVNMATYVGFHTAGILGGLVATLGLAAPSVIIILIIARVLKQFRENTYVDAAFYGLRPCSVGLIAAAGLLVVKIALFDFDAYALSGEIADLFKLKALILAAVLLVLTRAVKATKKLHPIFFILGSALVGVIFSF